IFTSSLFLFIFYIPPLLYFSFFPTRLSSDLDVCVPISKLPLLVHYARESMDEAGIDGGILGHVGDGNFHTFLLFKKEDEDERERALQVNEKLALKAIEVGGTCTGEHGVGLGKRKFQRKEHGDAVDIMVSMKQLLDPKNILNPGKIFE